MAAIAITTDGQQTEIRLDPPELGRVRITLEITDGNVTAHLSPDRPEVLDLLRRHANSLARDLLASGFDSVQTSLSDGRDDGRANDPSAQVAAAEMPPAEIYITVPSDRLDLRL